MENFSLPLELSAKIGSEKKDFVVKSSRTQPLSKTIFQIFFGFFFTSVSSFVFFPVFLNLKFTDFENIFFIIFLSIFLIIGISVFFSGIFLLFKKGGIFVGTAKKLIHFENGKTKFIDWEQFSGNIEISGDEKNGNISLEMRTGETNRDGFFVPDKIFISGISNLSKIFKICQQRIEENDPTPPKK